MACGQQAPARGSKNLIEIVRSTGQSNPPKVEYTAHPLESSTVQTSRPAVPVASPNYVRVLGSAAQNSRVPGSLHPGLYQLLWQSPLPSASSAVLLAGNRILVQRAGGWTLFDRGGKQIAEGFSGRATITLDPSAGMFFALGSGNTLHALGLEQGDLRFNIPLGYNESFIWPMFHRAGKRIIAAAAEQPMFAPKVQPPTRSLFQAIEIGTPIKLSPYKILLSVDVQQDLIFKDANMIPVASGDILWAVLPGLLIRTSPAQGIDGAWTDSFKAISASADEAGWLHMLVAAGPTATPELWIVTPEGRRIVRAQVPVAYRDSKLPPAIGYDRRIYLRSSRHMAAFSPQGELLWEAQSAAPIAGLSATPDGRIVIAAGRDIAVYDTNGNSTPLVTLPSAATTPPVVTVDGEILIGTEAGLFCFAVR